jgi:hypothetical protein
MAFGCRAFLFSRADPASISALALHYPTAFPALQPAQMKATHKQVGSRRGRKITSPFSVNHRFSSLLDIITVSNRGNALTVSSSVDDNLVAVMVVEF